MPRFRIELGDIPSYRPTVPPGYGREPSSRAPTPKNGHRALFPPAGTTQTVLEILSCAPGNTGFFAKRKHTPPIKFNTANIRKALV